MVGFGNGLDGFGSGMMIRSLSRFCWNLAFACFLLFRRVGYLWKIGFGIGSDDPLSFRIGDGLEID